MPKTRGRPKKQDVERYPSGKIKPAKQPTPKSNAISPTEVHRIREHGKKLGADPRLGSELGRLLLLEEITSTEAAAGFRIAEIYGRYEFQHGKRRSAKSPSYEAGRASGMDSYVADSTDEMLEGEPAAEVAFKSLPMQSTRCSASLRSKLERLCVDDEAVPAHWLPDIKDALVLHGQHFGQIKAGKKKKPQPEKPKTKETPRKPSTPIIMRERAAFVMLMQTVRPDWIEVEAVKAFDVYKAIAARTEFREDKAISNSNPDRLKILLRQCNFPLDDRF